MSAWAVAGQSLSLVVGGVGLGVGLALGGILWVERNRAGDLQDALLSETLARYGITAQLATCEAVAGLEREGSTIDATIPNDLDGFDLLDDWRVRPVERPGLD